MTERKILTEIEVGNQTLDWGLMMASRYDYIALAELLLRRGARPSRQTVLSAFVGANPEIMNLLFDEKILTIDDLRYCLTTAMNMLEYPNE